MGIFTISQVCIHMSKFIKMYTLIHGHLMLSYINYVSTKQFLKIPSAACGVSNIELANCSFIIENPILISKASALTHTVFGYGFRCLSAFTMMAQRGGCLMGEGVATGLLNFDPFLGKFILVVVNCFLLIVYYCVS